MTNLEELHERLKTAQNRCAIAQLLIELNKTELLHTALEDLYSGILWMLEDYSIDEGSRD